MLTIPTPAATLTQARALLSPRAQAFSAPVGYPDVLATAEAISSGKPAP